MTNPYQTQPPTSPQFGGAPQFGQPPADPSNQFGAPQGQQTPPQFGAPQADPWANQQSSAAVPQFGQAPAQPPVNQYGAPAQGAQPDPYGAQQPAQAANPYGAPQGQSVNPYGAQPPAQPVNQFGAPQDQTPPNPYGAPQGQAPVNQYGAPQGQPAQAYAQPGQPNPYGAPQQPAQVNQYGAPNPATMPAQQYGATPQPSNQFGAQPNPYGAPQQGQAQVAVQGGTGFGDPFASPLGPGSGERITHMVGLLLLIAPREYIPKMNTESGETDALRVDVVILDGPAAGHRADQILVFQKALKRDIRAALEGPHPYLLGRLAMGEAAKGKSAPYILREANDQEKWLAKQYIDTHTL